MFKKKLVVVVAAIALSLVATESLLGWPWSTDMYFQPSIRPLERAPMAPVEGTVSINAEDPMDRVKAGDALTNPVAADDASLKRGKLLFETYCAVCHGVKAKGDGPIAKKFAGPPNLTLPMYVEMKDGYIYGTIRNGGANMPEQGDSLAPADRWDVVNYLRSLQKQ